MCVAHLKNLGGVDYFVFGHMFTRQTNRVECPVVWMPTDQLAHRWCVPLLLYVDVVTRQNNLKNAVVFPKIFMYNKVSSCECSCNLFTWELIPLLMSRQ